MSVAFKHGRDAALNGWERISPYQKVKGEAEWYAGYDSVSKG